MALADRRPLAIQLRDELRNHVRQVGYRAGDQLPTEAELCEQFGVGRTTVREAFKLMEQDGLIHSRHGRGRFMAVDSDAVGFIRPLTRLEGVTDMLASRGFEPENHVMSVLSRAPSDFEREKLGLAPEEEVVELERLRNHDGHPLVYSTDVFPRTMVEGDLDDVDWSGSLFGWLEDSSELEVATATAEVTAEHLPPTVATTLDLDPADPWLVLVQEHSTLDGRPILLSRDYHRGNRFSFYVVRSRQA